MAGAECEMEDAPAPPKPPTTRRLRIWRPSVGEVARSETGHSAGSPKKEPVG
jgi:hypothetical protein